MRNTTSRPRRKLTRYFASPVDGLSEVELRINERPLGLYNRTIGALGTTEVSYLRVISWHCATPVASENRLGGSGADTAGRQVVLSLAVTRTKSETKMRFSPLLSSSEARKFEFDRKGREETNTPSDTSAGLTRGATMAVEFIGMNDKKAGTWELLRLWPEKGMVNDSHCLVDVKLVKRRPLAGRACIPRAISHKSQPARISMADLEAQGPD